MSDVERYSVGDDGYDADSTGDWVMYEDFNNKISLLNQSLIDMAELVQSISEKNLELEAEIESLQKLKGYNSDLLDTNVSLMESLEVVENCVNCKHRQVSFEMLFGDAPCNGCGVVFEGFASNWEAQE